MKQNIANSPENVIFCKKCVTSNQKVLSSSLISDDQKHSNRSRMGFIDGVCDGCIQVDRKYNQEIDWKERELKLKKILEKYRSRNGSYDCIVPGSGGKDSVFQAEILKKKYNMNPLTVTFSPHMYTEAGMKNFHNWPLNGDVHNFLYTPSGGVHKKLTQLAFKNLLHPFQPFIFGQRHFASHLALLFKIPLIFMGESQSEAGSSDEIDEIMMQYKYWAKNDNEKILISGLELDELKAEHNITKNDLKYYLPNDVDTLKKNDIRVLYLGEFERFEPQENYYLATRVTGFVANSERTQQTYTKFNSIDDKVDNFHYYTAYIKFGYGRCTEEATREIRNRYITREEGVALVNKYDHEFPDKYFDDFLSYINIKEEEFYETLDKFRPTHLWEKKGNDNKHCSNWILKHKVK
jgi:N-acetyl sugar amidotransferase